jgi:hypothetical protein
MTLSPKDRIDYYATEAEAAWTAYLITAAIAAPKTTPFTVEPTLAVFDESTFRGEDEEDEE